MIQHATQERSGGGILRHFRLGAALQLQRQQTRGCQVALFQRAFTAVNLLPGQRIRLRPVHARSRRAPEDHRYSWLRQKQVIYDPPARAPLVEGDLGDGASLELPGGHTGRLSVRQQCGDALRAPRRPRHPPARQVARTLARSASAAPPTPTPPHPPHHPTPLCSATAGRGRGIVAQQAIPAGQLLLAAPALSVVHGSAAAGTPDAALLLAQLSSSPLSAAAQAALGQLYDGSDSSLRQVPSLAELACAGEPHQPGASTSSSSSSSTGISLAAEQLAAVLRHNAFGDDYEDLAAAQLRGAEAQSHVGLWPAFSLANHSCAPTTVHYVVGRTMLVRAVEDIAPGSEVTVSYMGREEMAPPGGLPAVCHAPCTGQRGHRLIHGPRGDGTAGWVASCLPRAPRPAARPGAPRPARLLAGCRPIGRRGPGRQAAHASPRQPARPPPLLGAAGARQAVLQERYGFHCTCRRCTAESASPKAVLDRVNSTYIRLQQVGGGAPASIGRVLDRVNSTCIRLQQGGGGQGVCCRDRPWACSTAARGRSGALQWPLMAPTCAPAPKDPAPAPDR